MAKASSNRQPDRAAKTGKSNRKLTIAHVTHEAVEQLGGIGTVLEGLMTSPNYKAAVGRSILVGPTNTSHGSGADGRLGDHGKVLYSSVDGIDELHLAPRLRPIEWAFNTPIVYGTRHYAPHGTRRTGEAEVLLLDVSNSNEQRVNDVKATLWEHFDLDCARYQTLWDFEEYARLAAPAYYALMALLKEAELPCVLFSHEFMGMPAALYAMAADPKNFRTVFHAHECSTARRLVEDHPGHDVMFYNAMREARAQGLYVEDVFGPLDHFFRHALVRRTHLCDGIIAVGDATAEELHFLDKAFDGHPIDMVYNGIPSPTITPEEKLASRAMLLDYTEAALGFRPDYLFSHVTRPVISKGLWRDLQVCHELEPILKKKKERAVLYILTSAGGVRGPQDVAAMEKQYGWPIDHRAGYPDLVGPEENIWRDVEKFNSHHEQVKVVLVNQFGWSRDRIGAKLDGRMDMGHFRQSVDVEFGMSTYEPFGISPLEPLHAGAVCVISKVCGCAGFVNHVTGDQPPRTVLIADYVELKADWKLDDLTQMTMVERDEIEDRVAGEIARDLYARLPKDDKERKALLAEGQKLARKMGWDTVVEEGMLPMLERIMDRPLAGQGEVVKR